MCTFSAHEKRVQGMSNLRHELRVVVCAFNVREITGRIIWGLGGLGAGTVGGVDLYHTLIQIEDLEGIDRLFSPSQYTYLM